MQQTLTFLLIFLVTGLTSAQLPADVKAVLDSIVSHGERNSLYRNKVDWEATKATINSLAKGAKTVEELAPALKFMLESLGDEHGRVFHNGQQIAYYFGDLKPHQAGFNSELYGEIQQAQAYPFMTTLMKKNIGYVRIVGLPMGDNQAMAKQIEEAVCALQEQGATQWIVDLRYNGGGNLNPMAEGIAGIIGDGALGGSKGLTEQEDGDWHIENGDFYNYGYTVGLPNMCTFKGLPKVAVLTSLYTASSGEALAVMFKGRANTHFFGGKTIGMVTVTDWTQIGESTAMTISVSYYKDRNGRVYDQYVDVDEELPFEPTEDLVSDATIQKAIVWLCK